MHSMDAYRFCHHSNHVRYFFHSFMCSFTDSAGIESVMHRWPKYVIQKHRTLHGEAPGSLTVAFYEYAEFLDHESKILWPARVFVCSTFQIPVQVKNIPLNIKLKRHNIRLVPFIGLECLPTRETEFWEKL